VFKLYSCVCIKNQIISCWGFNDVIEHLNMEWWTSISFMGMQTVTVKEPGGTGSKFFYDYNL
jgi:hypothetical protein